MLDQSHNAVHGNPVDRHSMPTPEKKSDCPDLSAAKPSLRVQIPTSRVRCVTEGQSLGLKCGHCVGVSGVQIRETKK
jgi:hypothetical protein